MTSGAATDQVAFHHAALVYRSEQELLAAVVPAVDEGIAAGEPTLMMMDPRTAEMVRSALAEPSAVSFLDQSRYTNPAAAVRQFQELVPARVADGASRVRVVAEMSPLGTGDTWEWWARYEAAVTEACADLPMTSTCCYDSRVVTPDVLDDVVRAHPYLAGGDGARAANPRHDDPERFVRGRGPERGADPVESTPPLVDLTDPSSRAARHAVLEVADRARLERAEVDGFLIGVSETVANAICHGRPPVRLRLWSVPGRMVATVGDRGPGPRDPSAGLLPTASSASAGVGLWLAHQMCGLLTLGYHDEGFTVRIISGA
jgi:anti-sigma regulatory factor (Ser/Thr protein kinase)